MKIELPWLVNSGMNTQLILDLVLEHADVCVLLDCLFVSKYVYMRIMQTPEFRLYMQYLKRGVGLNGVYLHILEAYKGIEDDVMHDKLIEIYGRLQLFNKHYVKVICEYICGFVNHIQNVRFMNDMLMLVEKYYARLPVELLIAVFYETSNRPYILHECVDNGEWCINECILTKVMRRILDKGFDVNTNTVMYKSVQTNIFIRAIRAGDPAMIDMILDTRPDLYITDGEGRNAIKAMEDLKVSVYNGLYIREQYIDAIGCVFDKFDAYYAHVLNTRNIRDP